MMDLCGTLHTASPLKRELKINYVKNEMKEWRHQNLNPFNTADLQYIPKKDNSYQQPSKLTYELYFQKLFWCIHYI